MQETKGKGRTDSILEILEGADCQFCASGELVREPYKTNEAVVCSECGVPGAQIW